MKICLLTKFPPIQGGIAAKSYWLARGFAEVGNEIHVVTNASSVEEEYRIAGCEQHLAGLADIYIHSIKDEPPWHIPFSKTYTIRLLNLVLEVVREHNPQVIDAGFLMPYGVVAYLASRITGLPYIIRHGYSDLAKFFGNPEYNSVLELAIKNANLIITDKLKASLFEPMNPRIVVIPPYIPDERCFKPSVQRGNEKPVVAYIGKINYCWSNKSLIEMVHKIDSAFTDYEFVFVVQGNGLESFKKVVSQQTGVPITYQPFVPPWEMPELLSSFDYIALPDDKVIQSPSNLESEAQISGKSLITFDHENDSIHIASSDSLSSIRESDAFLRWIAENLTSYRMAFRSGGVAERWVF